MSHFFLTIIQPPPTSTLFPYTTLFRSLNAFTATATGRHCADCRERCSPNHEFAPRDSRIHWVLLEIKNHKLTGLKVPRPARAPHAGSGTLCRSHPNSWRSTRFHGLAGRWGCSSALPTQYLLILNGRIPRPRSARSTRDEPSALFVSTSTESGPLTRSTSLLHANSASHVIRV